MSWIKTFCENSFSIYAGNTLEAFQPLDFFHFYPLWYDLWIERIDTTLTRLDAHAKPFHEMRKFLPVPSSKRAILQKIIPSYRALPHKRVPQVQRVTEFFVRMLSESCPADPFGKSSTPLHRDHEILDILQNTSWQEGSPQHARMLGKLLTACGSLTHGIYNDLATDFGWDTYGPYDIREGDFQRTLLVRHFPDLTPTELWSVQYHAPYKDVSIMTMYEDVRWKIGCVGCHTILEKGNPITGLRKWAVIADGHVLDATDIETLTRHIAERAENLYRVIRMRSFEETKRMVLLQECYQMKKLFDAAGIDWRPTVEMYARIDGKPLLTGLVPHGSMMMSVEEYAREFGFHEFSQEVLGEHL